MALGGGRVGQVGERVQLAAQHFKHRLEQVSGQRPLTQPGFGRRCAQRRLAKPEEGQLDANQTSLCTSRCQRQPDDRVIAMAPCQLVECKQLVGRRDRQLASGDQLAFGQSGAVQVEKEILRRDAALALGALHHDDAVERHQAGRPFGRRIGISNRATPGAEVPDRPVRDMRRGQAQQRRMLGDQRRGFDLAMRGQRTNAQETALQ